MRAKATQTAALLLACVFLGWGSDHRQADSTSNSAMKADTAGDAELFEVRQQCTEIAAFFPVDLALAQRWVPPAFNLVVDAHGKASGALIMMNCPNYSSLATPNSAPLEAGENTAPASVVHLWFMLQGPVQILPIPGADVTAPTQYAYAVADLVTSPVAARVYQRVGKNAVLITGTKIADNGKRQSATITFTNGKKIALEAYTPTQLPTPLRLGGNVWNWHVGGAVEPDSRRGAAVATPTNINTTRVMFLGIVPGAPNSTEVTIHAEDGTVFGDYYGVSDLVASRATFFRPNNIVNNSSRGELAWRGYPPFTLNCPPLLPK